MLLCINSLTPLVFWCFPGVSKEISGMECINCDLMDSIYLNFAIIAKYQETLDFCIFISEPSLESHAKIAKLKHRKMKSLQRQGYHQTFSFKIHCGVVACMPADIQFFFIYIKCFRFHLKILFSYSIPLIDSFNYYFLFLHSKILILYLITRCLRNNVIFIQ